MKTGVYPGSFNPPTRAHLAIAEAARNQHRLDEVVLVMSRSALAKEDVVKPSVSDRFRILTLCLENYSWLRAEMTDLQLLADIASPYDVLIMGADKWEQIQQPHWYEGESHRQSALARLPQLAVAPRSPIEVPAEALLKVDESLTHQVSSTAARTGSAELMLPEALEFSRESGAWVDDEQYDRWLAARGGTSS